MKRDEKNCKISNILLPWQHFRFEPSLIRNTITTFSAPQLGHIGISLVFGLHWHSLINFRLKLFLNCLPVRQLKEYLKTD